MSPNAIDQAWGDADPAAAHAAGVRYVSMYLSWDPSKNITASKVRAYHGHGIACGVNWESQAGAPLNGAAQGRADATEAVRQLRALIKLVGYAPKNKLAITFSCDRDVTASQYPAIDAYYRAAGEIVHAAGFLLGAYGEAALVSHLHAAGLTDMEWQTVAWSGGVVSPQADLYQYAINQTLGGAAVDFDRIIHPAELGAWWPPGNPLDTDGEVVTPAEIAAVADAVYQKLLKTDGVIPSPDAATTTNKFWSFQSHVVATTGAARIAARTAAAILTRVIALQADVASLRAEVRAAQSGAVTVAPSSVPITGTLTIGATK